MSYLPSSSIYKAAIHIKPEEEGIGVEGSSYQASGFLIVVGVYVSSLTELGEALDRVVMEAADDLDGESTVVSLEMIQVDLSDVNRQFFGEVEASGIQSGVFFKSGRIFYQQRRSLLEKTVQLLRRIFDS